MINKKLPKIWYGGDYNPEQWDKEIMNEDLRMFNLSGIDVATLNVFSWALSQPNEDTYDFAWLDEIIDRLYENGTYVCLATSTGAHPAWMARKYPDVLRVDFEGRKRKFGGDIILVPIAQPIENIRNALQKSLLNATRITQPC